MCWCNKAAILCTAKEDIEIFKICHLASDSKVNSYFTYFSYNLNEVYKLEEGISARFNSHIHQYEVVRGFHSYSKNCSIERVSNALIVSNKCSRTLNRYYPYSIKVYGYIPKGSHYYLNDIGEYVSDAICLTKI